MTVAELIAELQKLPPELTVALEDECCGCSNDIDSVMVSDWLLDQGGEQYVALTG